MAEAVLGGVLIGVTVSLMLLVNGRVTGISGITASLLTTGTDKSWRILFLAGLIVGGIILRFFHPISFTFISTLGPLHYIGAGFLVGLGTVMGSGCTSGHGVCGLSRFSVRSLAATLIFIASGMLSTTLLKMILRLP